MCNAASPYLFLEGSNIQKSCSERCGLYRDFTLPSGALNAVCPDIALYVGVGILQYNHSHEHASCSTVKGCLTVVLGDGGDGDALD